MIVFFTCILYKSILDLLFHYFPGKPMLVLVCKNFIELADLFSPRYI